MANKTTTIFTVGFGIQYEAPTMVKSFTNKADANAYVDNASTFTPADWQELGFVMEPDYSAIYETPLVS